MCGVAFLFDDSRPEVRGERMARCLQRMVHRGPDAGAWQDLSPAAIGHRRLSIIDLAGSPQPLSDPTGRYWLSYNGEIYNYAPLRQSLASRWQFRSGGDTEVLLAGLILEGHDFLHRCEGMWAFVLWDTHTRSALLGRDRMGKKPLFFSELPGAGLACASELAALRTLIPGALDEDLDSAADFLRFGYVLPGTTLWRSIAEILPGHIGRWSSSGGLRQSPWWQLTLRPSPQSEADAVGALQHALEESVRKRLVADVEVGAFLSGGVDSSLICALASRSLDRRLKTFTIGFDEVAFDERRYARDVASHLNTEHHEEVLSDWDEAHLECLLLAHVGQAFGDASLLPTALVSRVAARHVKVALSGDGGDELFSGYQRYQARNILRWYTRLPRSVRHLAERAIRALPEPTAHHSRSLLKKAHLFLDVVGRQQAETPYVAPLMFAPDTFAALAPALAGRGHPAPGLPECAHPDDIARMMQADALVYLPQDILVKVDRASMACSLESRAPFLDREVVELAFSMPRHWHRRGTRGKRMLQQAFASRLPDGIWQRRKQGFGVPIHSWFRGALGERLAKLARDAGDGVLEPTAVDALLDAHRAGRRDHGYRLWTLYAYLLWRQNAR
ncbi:MAG: asparagine synthase (glutamine-hydrolyzing) [Rhodocyclaceae bacterium]|nr:asparagine synthase (glutamine-hydrolyzing) [Rhodocyclaceae bacterium]